MANFVFDAHSDLLLYVVARRKEGKRRVIEKEILPGMARSSISFRVLAVWIDEIFLPESALRRAMDMISVFYQEMSETDGFVLLKSANDFDISLDTKKAGFILALEGAEPIYNDIDLLYLFYQLGVRVVTLTWNNRNFVADGIKVGSGGGLTNFGRDVVKKMNELGMVVDVSHLGEAGFWDVIEIAEHVIASHSNAMKLCEHPRNLKDEQIRAISEKGGIIGVAAVPDFLSEKEASINDYVRHVEYMVSVGGVEHVGVGFDFAEYMYGVEEKIVTGLEGDRDVYKLASAFEDAGFDKSDIDKILGSNMIGYFKSVV